MSGSLPILVNHRAGAVAALGAALADRIHTAFAAAGLTVRLQLVAPNEIASAVEAHAAAPLLVVGGGDGTLGTALAERRGAGATGLLPLGTRNHLIRDLHIPNELHAAARVIAGGKLRAIDLGCLNGRAFVNNASVGLYPLMVRRRDREAHAGWPKWLATIPAAWAALARLPHHRMHLYGSATHGCDLRTPLLFVGNNRYRLDRGRVGHRVSLDTGSLSVFAITPTSRRGLLWLAARALVGRIDPVRDFSAVGDFARLTVRSRAGTIDVALDGEVVSFTPPLRFGIAPRAVRVCVPATP